MIPRALRRGCALTAAAAAFLAVSLVATAPALADTQSTTGSLTSGSPTATPPTGACQAGSTATHYAEIPFTTVGADATSLTISVQPIGFRANVVLYQGVFLPGAANVNCYDGEHLGSSTGSTVTWRTGFGALPGGFTSEPWVLVVYGATADDLGTFTASISSTNTGVSFPSAGDTTPPVLSLPGDLTVEATGAAGRVVDYSASASDAVDGAVTPSCSPASGSAFPLGVTKVTCTATDGSGNRASGNFTVTVQDTIAPVITTPGPLNAPAMSTHGATVSYDATAGDAVDGADVVNCAPASGSTFPIGATQVNCTATDHAGNTATATFEITIDAIRSPGITAHLRSHHRGKHGWYRGPVTVRFTCHVGSAPLVRPCPGPRRVSANGHHTITRSIRAADGGAAKVTVHVKVDHAAPRVHIVGARAGHVYLGAGPGRVRCAAKDKISHVASRCRLVRHRSGDRISYTARVKDRAGNVATARKSYRVIHYFVAGVPRKGSRFVVHTGHTYRVLAHVRTAHAPVYLHAAPQGVTPGPASPALKRVGPRTWSVRVTITRAMQYYSHWTLGVRANGRVHQIAIQIRP